MHVPESSLLLLFDILHTFTWLLDFLFQVDLDAVFKRDCTTDHATMPQMAGQHMSYSIFIISVHSVTTFCLFIILEIFIFKIQKTSFLTECRSCHNRHYQRQCQNWTDQGWNYKHRTSWQCSVGYKGFKTWPSIYC